MLLPFSLAEENFILGVILPAFGSSATIGGVARFFSFACTVLHFRTAVAQHLFPPEDRGRNLED